MTSNGHNARGTDSFERVTKPGLTEPVMERVTPCPLDTWCTMIEGHGGPCHVMPKREGPVPPVGWHLTLPAPRPWCRFCATPAPIIRDAGVDRLGPHDNCKGENTLAADHPKFRG